MRWTNLSQGAAELETDQCLNGFLNEIDQSELGSSFIESLTKWTSLSLRVSELETDQFLNRILNEIDQPELSSFFQESLTKWTSLILRLPFIIHLVHY